MIAFVGHLSRGKEIIQILKSLGGKEMESQFARLYGTNEHYIYFISKHGYIICEELTIEYKDKYDLYTIEEFEKEFPFKIGDKCEYYSHAFNDTLPATITGFVEAGGILMYRIENNYRANIYIQSKYLKPTSMTTQRTVQITLEKAKEWYKKGGDLKEVALQAFDEKDLIDLPKTWTEYEISIGHPFLYCSMPTKYKILYQLEILRDVYRQGWKPNWDNKKEIKYSISRNIDGRIDVIKSIYVPQFLSFQSQEIAELFCTNFKNLINEVGDLI